MPSGALSKRAHEASRSEGLVLSESQAEAYEIGGRPIAVMVSVGTAPYGPRREAHVDCFFDRYLFDPSGA
jgi:hypothetical protein